MTVKITPNDRGNPPGKLADAELHFSDGPLDGQLPVAVVRRIGFESDRFDVPRLGAQIGSPWPVPDRIMTLTGYLIIPGFRSTAAETALVGVADGNEPATGPDAQPAARSHTRGLDGDRAGGLISLAIQRTNLVWR